MRRGAPSLLRGKARRVLLDKEGWESRGFHVHTSRVKANDEPAAG